jgi:gliding motility-associated-like protein
MARLIKSKVLYIGFFLLLLGSNVSRLHATHIIGGELIYDCLGTDGLGNYQYRLTLKVYRDCNPGTSAYDNPAFITIWDGAAIPGFIDTVAIPFPGAIVLPFVNSDPCFIPPVGVCVEEAIYSTVITVPPSLTGYVFAYQRCCRNNTIINILDPGSNGATYTESVPDTILCNNSPRYNNFPPIALCINNPLVFDHSATDPDGDSLVYYICSPYNGAQFGDAQPPITSAPPFDLITFIAPFDALNPITAAPPLAINPVTGILTLTPTQIGQFVVGICCDEYRNGVLIGTHSRDFQFNVTNCTQVTPVNISSGSIVNGVLSTDSVFTEGCELGLFVITRDSVGTSDTLEIVKGGNAIEGIDYDAIPDQIVIPVGVVGDTIVVTANVDGVNEGTDTLSLTLTYIGLCGTTTVSTNVYIEDYIPMVANMTGDTVICPGLGSFPVLEPTVTGGYGGYHYLWYPTQDTTDTLVAALGQTTVFYVNVEDDCGKVISSAPVTIIKQCPIVIPNVISSNGDGNNDVFIIQNIGDYPENEVWFYNRWGTLLHYAKYYQNDWAPKVTDGVYYYVVDNKAEEPYKGFFTVFSNQ